MEREPDGTAHVRNQVSGTTEGAAAIGAVIEGLLAFAFPLAGIAIGGALGAAVGRLLDTGVSGKFVDELKTSLAPGRSALFLVVKDAEVGALIASLRDFEGEVTQTTLDSEAEEALREALK